jgi:hypothetical protein
LPAINTADDKIPANSKKKASGINAIVTKP